MVTRPITVTLLIRCVPRPIRTPGPTTQNGPIRTSSSSSARGSTAALCSTWMGMFRRSVDGMGLGRFAQAFLDAAFGEQGFDEFSVQAMTALVGNEMSDQVAARQGQVAHQVQGL